ncbi:MAG: hypothetical protein Q8P41_02315 [Pseudomonadota bacterium]|nr:hypothetical protein [Pseudomonadota bacterium]
MTRPSFVLTNREVGAPDLTEAEVLDALAAAPSPATVFSLAKLSQWHAANMHQDLAALLKEESVFTTDATFAAIKAACAKDTYRTTFRYSAILAAIRAVIARGRASPSLDPAVPDVERVGDSLLQLNRLVGGDNTHVLVAPPEQVRKEWLGEMVVCMQEHPPTPTFVSWAIGALVFRSLVGHPALAAMDLLLTQRRLPSLARMFGGLTIWFGYSAQSERHPHLWRLTELQRLGPLERAAAFIARRLSVRRRDGEGLVTNWLGSPTASRMVDRPFFCFRGTAVVADPFTLAEIASVRFGQFAKSLVSGAKGTPEAAVTGAWQRLWATDGFETFIRQNLGAVASGCDQPPSVPGFKPCDAVARFGRHVLFVEAKLMFPRQADLQVRDRLAVVDALVERYGQPKKKGICQTLSTMKWAISNRAAFPNSNPNGDDRWWSVVVSAEQVPMTREWRDEWRRLALAMDDRPKVHQFHGTVFLNLHEFCWLIEGARQGKAVGDLLAAFLAGNDISFGNFAARAIGRGIPNWLDASVKDSMAWLTEEIARSAKSRRPRGGRSTK